MENRQIRRRKSNIYRVCPHCEKEVNFKAFKLHKKLYYDLHTKKWTKHGRNDVLDDDTSNSEVEFSPIEEVSSDLVLSGEDENKVNLKLCVSDIDWDDEMAVSQENYLGDMSTNKDNQGKFLKI